MKSVKYFILVFLGILIGCNEEEYTPGPFSGVPGKKLKLWENAYEDGTDLLFEYNDNEFLESESRVENNTKTLLSKYEYVNNRLTKWIFYNETGESHGYIEYDYPGENKVTAIDYRPTANDEFFVNQYFFENDLIKEIRYTSISWPDDYTHKHVFEHDAEGNLTEVKVFYGDDLNQIFNFTYSNHNSMFQNVTPHLALLSWGPEPFFSFRKLYDSVRKRTYQDGILQSDYTREYNFEFDTEGYPILLKAENGNVQHRYDYY
ncbi:hypothetical protein [Gramella sp. KN1008]|uniref:hypothetical protein n=1 Tax=Gramella sp. KN1008 TaxID=2529298 RepID=UPI00103CA1B1|nr:hypothetical protein [Gramella sp. KN1008]TBW25881.1 hypothetical protein EZJ28_14710 [Gramella sp. KN1008]